MARKRSKYCWQRGRQVDRRVDRQVDRQVDRRVDRRVFRYASSSHEGRKVAIRLEAKGLAGRPQKWPDGRRQTIMQNRHDWPRCRQVGRGIGRKSGRRCVGTLLEGQTVGQREGR
jgi:hypothetical protein